MNFLVVSRISIPAKDRTLPCWEYLRSLGHTVTVEHPDTVPTSQRPDVMVSMGVTVMAESFAALERFPGVPLWCMNWDVYAWIWEPGQEGKVQAKHAIRPQEYDYVEYGDILRRAREIWVPSHCTGLRTTQWYGLKNWHVILSACPYWDWPPAIGEGRVCDQCGGYGTWVEKPDNPTCPACGGDGIDRVRDDGYALCCLREIPDPWWGMFERCCEELKIPYRCTKHEVSYEEYQKAVAHCRFLCAPLYELSTGGLSLMEGYYLGKPVLISDSEWNGGSDYFGDRAAYFRHGDIADFKAQLEQMYYTPSIKAPRDECRQWIEANYSDKRMVDDILRRIKAHEK